MKTAAGETQLELSLEAAERLIVDAARAFGEAYRGVERADSAGLIDAERELDRCLFELLLSVGVDPERLELEVEVVDQAGRL